MDVWHIPLKMHDVACALSLAVASAMSFFLLPDSGGCARKRAAMSVTLTSVKRVQSSPNLLAAGIISLTHQMSHLNGFI